MSVYFIAAESLRLIKIGRANNPLKRLGNLQTGNPVKLKLLAVIDGECTTEKDLHNRFASVRNRGEWFRHEGELKEFINSLPRFRMTTCEKFAAPRNIRKSFTKLDKWLIENEKSATSLARDCGVSVSTITRLAKGEAKPSLRLMRAIFKHTRGKVKPNDFLPEPNAAEPATPKE